MKYADLHVHTFYSDSTFSPEEAVSCAAKKGLSAIAICDHDSLEGIDPSREAGLRLGVEVISGVELGVEEADAEVHILGYFVDHHLEWLGKKLGELRAFRIGRIHSMVDKLNAAGLNMKAEDVFKVSGMGSVGRLHVAKAMLDTGNVRTYKEAFGKYIGFRKPCYIPNMKFSPTEAIGLVLKAGGVPVLAHPAVMGRDDLIPELVRCGLKGIEVYHTEHKASDIKRYEDLALEYGLLMTGGSDCHGLGKGRVLMGGVRIPYTLVERLRVESKNIRKR